MFADMVNVLLFNGKPIVKENELEDSTVHSSINLDNRTGLQERDVVKDWKGSTIRICLFGFENQTQIDKDMPLRIMSYGGASYKQQLLDRKKPGRYPVVTLYALYKASEAKQSFYQMPSKDCRTSLAMIKKAPQ